MGMHRHWLSFHFAYHQGCMDHLIVECIRPSVRDLSQASLIESFFFMRYSFGGPHVRLRLLPRPGSEDEIRSFVTQRTGKFFLQHPSPASIPDEKVLRINRALRQHDNSNEPEDRILADNAIQEIPFEPEADRYGGETLLPHSLEFFALSSVRALDLLSRRKALTDGQWLSVGMRLMARYALGFASDGDELRKIVAFPQSAERRVPDIVKERGDNVFSKSGEKFRDLLSREIQRLAMPLPEDDDIEAARHLAYKLRESASAVRMRIAVSQIHMTANRLGLRNVDEIYIARLLTRALEDIEAESPAVWESLEEQLDQCTARPSSQNPRPGSLLPVALSLV